MPDPTSEPHDAYYDEAVAAEQRVVRHEHEGGSQTWHVWVDETEFVAYLNGPTGMHAAWRLEPPSPLMAGAAASPVVSIYDPEPQRDVEVLLRRMPDEPAALLRDAIFPF